MVLPQPSQINATCEFARVEALDAVVIRVRHLGQPFFEQQRRGQGSLLILQANLGELIIFH
jgi:hypothetical protein